MSLVLHAALLLMVSQPPATVTGLVQDEATGEPLAGAVVALPDLHRAAPSDSAGRYAIRFVAPGRHVLEVRALGHARRTLQVIVPADGSIEINVALASVPIRVAGVEVRGLFARRSAASDAGPDPARRSRTVASMFHDPFLPEPDALHALEGGGVGAQTESPSGLHVNGGASDQTAYALDGVPDMSPYHAAGLFAAWNPDALDRVDLLPDAESAGGVDVLSGTVAAVTREPGATLRTRGGVSTTHARFALDGPLPAGSGFLLCVRSGFPAAFAPRDEASYLHGETGDWLVKVVAPVLGGRARVLTYGSDDEIAAAATDAPGAPRSNVFEWGGRSYGVEWTRDAARVLAWDARGYATAAWLSDATVTSLTSSRAESGVLASITRASTTIGVRASAQRAAYAIVTNGDWRLASRTPVVTLFGEHARGIGGRATLTAGARVTAASAGTRVSPDARLRWTATQRLVLSAACARQHQFAQSLRNTESVAGSVFPADVFVAAGASGVPIARSDQATVAAAYRPWNRLRVELAAFDRAFDGLALVAPRESLPFAAAAHSVCAGRGTARGVSAATSFTTRRCAAIVQYGAQRVRSVADGVTYVPEHGTAHRVDCGLSVFPGARSSIRVGATAEWGRRATAVTGPFEWEACNLLDRGCEFLGDPRSTRDVGGLSLPSYVRVDLSVRRVWLVTRGGAELAVFGTATNLLGRRNILTYVRDDASGALTGVEMRPRAPLVVGVDWR